MNIDLIITLTMIFIATFIVLFSMQSAINKLQDKIRDLNDRIEKLENNESRNDNE